MTTRYPFWLKQIRYEKAPIREAIINIQIEKSPSLTMAKLESFTKGLSQAYIPQHKVIFGQLTGHMDGETLKATAQQDPLGFALIGAGGKQVVQFTQAGFIFSRLAPYQNWNQLRDEAKRLWGEYRPIIGDAPITRIGLRYVNQLDLPQDLRDFRDYLRIYPEISTDLPQQLAGFFMQVQIPQVDLNATAILNETILPPSSPNVVSVILDIDVFRNPINVQSDDAIWELFEAFRIRKNLIFEGCITNKTRELISDARTADASE